MESLIHYEELTWPEVAALPRDIPLVLPLGDGYDHRDIRHEVKAGWRGGQSGV
jgi:hypothetical protein